ncbi:MAG: LA_2272 family surface repeat-containing protein [Bacteroidota bacterium]
MKTLFKTLIIAFVLINTKALAQDTIKQENETTIYTVALNIVPDGFNAPLIGFVNIAKGHHKSAHVGFVNFNYKSFSGLQLGYVNTSGGSAEGVQAGFVNTTTSSFKGLQYGFVNTITDTTQGVQVGFVNTSAKEAKGVQSGFVNACSEKISGVQIGFVNAARDEIEGLQAGFVNVSGNLKGLQIGFVNLADSLDEGLPIGFLSIVRKGGYQAIELSVNEMYPLNLSFKIGVPMFYTSFITSYNPGFEKKFAVGAGMGSVISINESLFFNPELVSLNTLGNSCQQTTSFTAGFGYAITPNIHIIAGPSVAWNYNPDSIDSYKPFLPIFEHHINDKKDMIVGFRFGLRYSFQGL